ncbi:MAG: phage terminase large subunit [Alphaproteobacteria bacterium]|nr:phage terminase large subunit [Alphaproteobacteria bacterium]
MKHNVTPAGINLLASGATFQLARQFYMDYVKLVHHGKWLEAPHLKLICDEMDKIISGETKRLMIFMPPRHGKSMSVTKTFPSFFLGRFPDKRVIEVSYSDTFAQEFGEANRSKIEEFGNTLFGIKCSTSQSSKVNWNIAGRDGGMISVGVGGGITGKGADLLIIDDPIKNRQEAESETYRRHLKEEYESSIYTRLHPGAAIIVILTRWHDRDLAASLLSPEDGTPEDWKVLSLPCVCEDEKADLLHRKNGEALWPARGYDVAWAERVKMSIGSYAWNSLYQQRPSPPGGSLFKREWWQRWDVLPGDLFDYIQSWDCTFKDKETSDFVVGQVWARSRKNPANRYLLDQVRARMNFTATIQAIRDLSAKWPKTTRKLIEDTANGPAIISVLKKEIPGIVPVNPEGGKVVRAHAVTASVESKNVYLPSAAVASWVGDFIEEFANFPNGKHDDQVDAMTQANAYYNDGSNNFDLEAIVGRR